MAWTPWKVYGWIHIFFVWDFPHFVSTSDIYSFICVREQSVCHVVSTWRVHWVPLARERTLGTIARLGVFVRRPLVWLLLSAVCFFFLANFDLFLRFGGSLRPYVLVFETLAAEFIFDAPFIMRWVNIRFLFVYARNSWMNKGQSCKVLFSDRTVYNYIFKLCHIEIASISWKSRQFPRKIKFGETMSRRAVCNCRKKFYTRMISLLSTRMLLKLVTGNGERGTGNGERGTGNGKRETRNGKRGTENGSLGTSVQR